MLLYMCCDGATSTLNVSLTAPNFLALLQTSLQRPFWLFQACSKMSFWVLQACYEKTFLPARRTAYKPVYLVPLLTTVGPRDWTDDELGP